MGWALVLRQPRARLQHHPHLLQLVAAHGTASIAETRPSTVLETRRNARSATANGALIVCHLSQPQWDLPQSLLRQHRHRSHQIALEVPLMPASTSAHLMHLQHASSLVSAVVLLLMWL